MSRYATKWKPISKEEYFEIYNGTLSVYSSYSNPDGNDGLTYTPQMLTTWGNDEKELIRHERTKENRDANDWEYKYWKALEWEVEE